MKNYCSDTFFSGIPSSEYNICRYRRSSFGRCTSWFPFAAYLDTHGSQAAKDVGASKDKLSEIFNRVEHFFLRLEIYTGIKPTTAMTDIVIEIMVEVLVILAIATKEAKRGQLSELISSRFMIVDQHII
jgi:hypothetical protein